MSNPPARCYDSQNNWPVEMTAAMRTPKTQRLDLFVNFVACVRAGSITRAAAEAGLSRTALWQQVQALQRIYGVVLFRRTRYGVALTPDGEQFLALVEPLVAGFVGLPAALHARRSGLGPVLRIACPDSIEENELVPVLEGFRAANPGIRVEVLSSMSRGIPKLVAAGDAGVGIEVDPHDVGAAGLRYDRLFERRIYLALRDNHPLLTGQVSAPSRGRSGPSDRTRPPAERVRHVTGRLTLERLAAYPFAAEPTGSRLRERVERAFVEAGLESGHRVELESSRERALLATVARGPTVAVVSGRTPPEVPLGVRLVAAGRLFGRMPVYLVSKPEPRDPAEARFQAHVRRVLQRATAPA